MMTVDVEQGQTGYHHPEDQAAEQVPLVGYEEPKPAVNPMVDAAVCGAFAVAALCVMVVGILQVKLVNGAGDKLGETGTIAMGLACLISLNLEKFTPGIGNPGIAEATYAYLAFWMLAAVGAIFAIVLSKTMEAVAGSKTQFILQCLSFMVSWIVLVVALATHPEWYSANFNALGFLGIIISVYNWVPLRRGLKGIVRHAPTLLLCLSMLYFFAIAIVSLMIKMQTVPPAALVIVPPVLLLVKGLVACAYCLLMALACVLKWQL